MNTRLIGTFIAVTALASACNNSVPQDKPRDRDTGTDAIERPEPDTGEVDELDDEREMEAGEAADSDVPQVGESAGDTGEQVPDARDRDGDGVTEADGDCDDLDDRVAPTLIEICDGIDNDCDGVVDEASAMDAGIWYADVDGDGFGDAATSVASCSAPDGFVADATDCDDAAAAVHPAADEICDGLDNDCNGSVDEGASEGAGTWYADADGDGFGDAATSVASCSAPTGFVADASDCDDADPTRHPDAAEACDGIDNDCDGAMDEEAGTIWYVDLDGDGFGDPATSITSCESLPDYVPTATDCDDTDASVYPGAEERCDGIDSDCDGMEQPGIATLFDEHGDSVSMTASLTGTPGDLAAHTFTAGEILRVCEGTWYVELTIQPENFTIEGVGDRDNVVLSSDPTGGHYVSLDQRPVTARSSVNDLVVRNLTLADGVTPYGGGCLAAEDAEVTLDNVTVRDCTATGNGGGVFIDLGNLRLENSLVTGNSSDGRGGGVFVDGAAIVEHSEISENEAGQGGGVAVFGSSLMTDVFVFENSALDDGGGIYIWEGNLTGQDLEIRRNHSEDDGGGIYVGVGALDLESSVVTANSAADNGGGVLVEYGDVTLTGSAVVDNDAGGYGGGLHVYSVFDISLSISQSYIEDNVAEEDGGGASVVATDSTATVTCAGLAGGLQGFRGNQAMGGYRAGGLFMEGDSTLLVSRGCDWGADDSDNSMLDIATDAFSAEGEAADYPLFTCTTSSCSGDVTWSYWKH